MVTKMDLKKFNMEQLLLAAIKSEIDSHDVYNTLSLKVKTAYLVQKLGRLADEEKKHRLFLEEVFKITFPKKKIKVPKTTPVPLPSITVEDKNPYVSTVLESAMVAEKAAKDFYTSLAIRFPKDKEISEGLASLAQMEAGHYKVLEIEVEKLKTQEDYLIDWPMMHSGP
jgi:rubrerythrin